MTPRAQRRFACFGVVFVLSLLCVAWAFGADVLQQIYEGRSWEILNGVIRDQSVHSFENYLDAFHRFSAQISFAVLGLCLLLIAIALPTATQSLTRVSWVVVGLLLGWAGAQWLSHVHWAISYPFELDYGEGALLGQVLQLLGGDRLYGRFSEAPFVVTNYPPVYQGLVSLVSGLGFDVLMAGRLVSTMSTLVSAFLIGSMVAHASREYGRFAQLVGACTASLLFVSVHYVSAWGPLMRVDMLSVCLSLAGLTAFALVKPQALKVGLAACFLVLALFTKQSAISAPAACLLAALAQDKNLAAKLFAALAIGGGTVLASALLLTGGEFWAHVVVANRNAFSLARLSRHWINMAWLNGGMLAVAVPTAVRHLRKRDSDGLLLASFFVCAFVVSATVGKIGSNVNYLIETMAAASTLCGLAVASVFARIKSFDRSAQQSSAQDRSLLPLAIATALWVQLSLPHAFQLDDSEHGQPRIAASHSVLDEIRGASGTVVSEDMTLLGLAGRAIYFQPFTMTQLHHQGLWNQQGFLAQLDAKEFPLIVLERDARAINTEGAERFSPEMRDAMIRNYRKKSQFDTYHLYEPRHRNPGLTHDAEGELSR